VRERGARFECPAARKHHRDHRAGEVFAHDQRADEREQRDHVDAEPPVARRVRDPPRRGDHRGDRQRRPHRVCRATEPEEEQQAARSPSGGREYEPVQLP
jgi:hypothetical protein